MWLVFIGGALLILAILGGVLLGGVFTIVLVPLALIAAGAAIAYGMYARASQPGGSANTSEGPLPSGQQSESGHARTSPEALADARRAQQ
jgi:hypothetical protein